MKRTFAVLITALTLTGNLTRGEETGGFADLLDDKTAPLTLRLKNLDSDWRRFTLSGSGGSPAVQGFALAMLGAMGGGGNCYYTRGQTITRAGATFLVAYRLAGKPVDMSLMMRRGPEGMPPPEKPTPESELLLCLLPVRNLEPMLDIRRFDLELEMTGGDTSAGALAEAREKAATARGLGHLHQIGLGLLAYAAEGDKSLPPLKDVAATKKALLPYCGNKEAVFNVPGTNQPYLPNPSLAGRKLAEIANPAEIIVFYEAQPAQPTRAVLYLDGHTERVNEANWPALKKASSIP